MEPNEAVCKRCGTVYDWLKEEERTEKHFTLWKTSASDTELVDLCPTCLNELIGWYFAKQPPQTEVIS